MNSRSLIEANAPLVNCSCARHSPTRSSAAVVARGQRRRLRAAVHAEQDRSVPATHATSCASEASPRWNVNLSTSSVRIHLTTACRSGSGTCGFGVIGISPQTPDPPFFTFSTSAASTSLPWYLAATSLKAGPTTLWSTAWHAVQPYFAGIWSGDTDASAAGRPAPEPAPRARPLLGFDRRRGRGVAAGQPGGGRNDGRNRLRLDVGHQHPDPVGADDPAVRRHPLRSPVEDRGEDLPRPIRRSASGRRPGWARPIRRRRRRGSRRSSSSRTGWRRRPG